MFVIVKDGLFGAYPFRICAEWMARVGIPVDERKITAGDGDPQPMPLFEDMACEHQTNGEFVNVSRCQQ